MLAEYPLRTHSTLNKREHWAVRAKRAKAEREAACLFCPRNIALPCVVTLTRIAPRELDGDNLAASFKATRDGIADRIGVNDRDPLVTWEYQQMRGKPKEYRVRIEVRPR
jgi:hypothetical protein